MAQSKKPDGARTPTREEEARRDLGNTLVSTPKAWFLVLFFLVGIYGVPLTQVTIELVDEEEGVPTPLAVGKVVGSAVEGWRTDGGFFNRLMASNAAALRAIDLYEEEVEDRSFLTKTLLGPVQEVLTRIFGLGNEEAYIGRDGWLFYRADVDHLTGPPFLSPEWLDARSMAGNEYAGPPQPDPRKAILQFQEQLADRGIRLLIMPTPVKPSIEGRALVLAPGRVSPPIVNASFKPFLGEMKSSGVQVFNPVPLLANFEEKSGTPAYLKTDTHWSFEGMQAVARELAANLETENPGGGYETSEETVTNLGDIAVMLRLPEAENVIQPETVQLQRPQGEPTSDKRILLLGDSFTNIYSQEGLGWGADAGLAEQLQAASGRPVEKIALNAGGAHAARTELIRRLSRGRDPLAGVDTVVWQFATRELSQGDWRLMELPEATPSTEVRESAPMADDDASIPVTGVIVERTFAPAPGSVPYPDCLVSLHLRDVRTADGSDLPDELLVYTWGLQDGEWVHQSFEAGQRVQVELAPWQVYEEDYGSLNRKELLSEAAFLLDLYWAPKVNPAN